MDWLFEYEHCICHVRVTGLLLRGGFLLAQRSENVYALPGGHLRFGETSEEALKREYREETGADIGWVSVDDLPRLCIYPTFLAEEIYRLQEAPKHFIRHESF